MDIIILLLLIFLNALFAMAELALVSSRKVRLIQWAEDGKKGAKLALRLIEDPNRFLSTIQIGITLISITSGVYAETSIARDIQHALQAYPGLIPYSKGISDTLVIVLVTLLSLIFGELVPKRLAMLNPELTSTALARPMSALSTITSPLVKLLGIITNFILNLLRAKKSNEPSITEDEIKVLIEQGTDEGIFDRAEQALVENIFRLDDRKIASIMTPRIEITYLNLSDSNDENIKKIQNSNFSRFPVCNPDIENIIGIVDSKNMLNRILTDNTVDFMTELNIPLYVPASVSLIHLLEQFKMAKTHIALVVDEYGELEGLVTMNDVLEAIVGDVPITGEYDDKIVKRDESSWLVDGAVTIDEFKNYFNIYHDELMPGEDTGNIHTLGGVIMYKLDKIPQVTDKITWNLYCFEVVDMDKTRIDKIMVYLS